MIEGYTFDTLKQSYLWKKYVQVYIFSHKKALSLSWCRWGNTKSCVIHFRRPIIWGWVGPSHRVNSFLRSNHLAVNKFPPRSTKRRPRNKHTHFCIEYILYVRIRVFIPFVFGIIRDISFQRSTSFDGNSRCVPSVEFSARSPWVLFIVCIYVV